MFFDPKPRGVAVPLPPAVLFFENKHPFGEKVCFGVGRMVLDPIFPCGPHVAPVCPHVAPMWTPCGPRVAPLWPSFGPLVTPMWPPCGPSVAPMWPTYTGPWPGPGPDPKTLISLRKT